MTRRFCTAVLPSVFALICGLSMGCSSDGHRVSGKVTFKGQPVPAGKIYFMPDGGKGNSGPTGYANINDGRYDTSAPGGKGIAGGPMNISIEGLDPSAPPDKADKSGEITVKMLFPRYETTADLPKSESTKDFDVPADAAKGPKPPAGSPLIVP